MLELLCLEAIVATYIFLGLHIRDKGEMDLLEFAWVSFSLSIIMSVNNPCDVSLRKRLMVKLQNDWRSN